MVNLISENGSSDSWGSMPLAVGLVVSALALVALCVKHTRSKLLKYRNKPIVDFQYASSPKHLLTSISNKAMPFMISRKKANGDDDDEEEADVKNGAKEVGFGEDELWKKSILMGEKCKLPEFPGVIYYDSHGNQLREPPPRSPRASPLSNFMLPVVKNEQ